MKVARDNRYGHRDASMILVAFRHGFRSSELVDLRWDQIDFDTATMAVRRAKRGTPATHPIRGDESRALRKLQRDQDPKSPFVAGLAIHYGGVCPDGGTCRRGRRL